MENLYLNFVLAESTEVTNITVGDVTNSSFHISWNEPVYKNGDIILYNVNITKEETTCRKNVTSLETLFEDLNAGSGLILLSSSLLIYVKCSIDRLIGWLNDKFFSPYATTNINQFKVSHSSNFLY